MAEVYLAVLRGEEGFEKPAVVKRMLPELAMIERFRRMFIDEARLMASLSHSNVVAVLDFGSLDGSYFPGVRRRRQRGQRPCGSV